MKRTRLTIACVAIWAICSPDATADRITIVSENKAVELWTLAPGAARVVAGYPSAAADKAQDVCVNIGYLIHKDGSTSNFTQMKAWSSAAGDQPKPEVVQPFVQSAAAAVSMWRLAPRSGKAKSIYTSATFAFDGRKLASVQEISANCRIDDLPQFVAKATADKERRGDLGQAKQDAQDRVRDMATREAIY